MPRRGKPEPKRITRERFDDFLEHRLHQLIMKSMGKYHVTAAMLKRSARSTASVKAIQLAFRKRSLSLRSMPDCSTYTLSPLWASASAVGVLRRRSICACRASSLSSGSSCGYAADACLSIIRRTSCCSG